MKLFDTHAHYTDRRFEAEYPGGADALLTEAFENGVEGIVNVSVNSANAVEVINQAAKYGKMYVAVGTHPTDSRDCDGIDSELLRIEELLKNKRENKIVAVGEIGYDYYWEPFDKVMQGEYFRRQMELARKYDLPAMIHDRDAHGDTLKMLAEFPDVISVIHSCSLSADSVREVCKGGNVYVSFSGTVTFKNAARVKEAASAVPLDRLLSETDCPYLAPHPHRGKLNYSMRMVHTVDALAEIHGISSLEMQDILVQNARKMLGL